MSSKKNLNLSSPLTLAMSTAILISGAQTVSAAPCSPVMNTVTVTSNAGDNESSGSFQVAVIAANDDPNCTQIQFAPSVTDIDLSGYTSITTDVNIIGPGADQLDVSSYESYAIHHTGGNLHIEGLTISGSSQGVYSNGSSSDISIREVNIDGNNTGVFASNFSSLEISDSVIQNSSFAGSVNLNQSGTSLTIDSSLIRNNANSGGQASGFSVNATNYFSEINILDSSFDNNEINGSGAALQFSANSAYVTVNVENTSFTNNEAQNGGGVNIFADASSPIDVTIHQSTFSGNTANGGVGGGLRFDTNNTGSTLAINSSTIFNNSANSQGGGIYIDDNSYAPGVTISNTVIANNEATESDNDNFYGTVNSVSHSWIGESTGMSYSEFAIDENTVIDGANEASVLLPLASNGALGKTHLPDEDSPLVDAGDPDIEDAPDTDQNGKDRIFGGVIDIGATEYHPAPAVPPTDPVDEKSSSGSFLWLTPMLALLGLRRRKR